MHHKSVLTGYPRPDFPKHLLPYMSGFLRLDALTITTDTNLCPPRVRFK